MIVTILLVSQIFVWAMLILMATMMVALARQVGVLHERIAPMGALTMAGGPSIGEHLPLMSAVTLDGEALTLGGASPRERPLLLMFVAPSCPVCKKVSPIAKHVAKSDGLDLVFISDGDVVEQKKMIGQLDIAAYPFVNSPDIGMRLQVGKLPYAFLLNAEGLLVAKGLINSREHIESLVVAKDTGFPSAQSYLKQMNLAAAE